MLKELVHVVFCTPCSGNEVRGTFLLLTRMQVTFSVLLFLGRNLWKAFLPFVRFHCPHSSLLLLYFCLYLKKRKECIVYLCFIPDCLYGTLSNFFRFGCCRRLLNGA